MKFSARIRSIKEIIAGYSREGLGYRDTWQGLCIPMIIFRIMLRRDTVTGRLEFKDWITRFKSLPDLAEYEVFIVSICGSVTAGTAAVEI